MDVEVADLLWAIALGLVQGVTEFVPVSSSAHLLLLPHLLGAENPLLTSLDFAVALHLGTAIAISAAMAPAWLGLVRAAARPPPRTPGGPQPRNILAAIVVASVVTGIVGVLAEDLTESVLRDPALAAAALLIGALLMFLADRRAGNPNRGRFWSLTLAGSTQVLAPMPGVSRSGAIFSAARYFGLDRRRAIDFAFLMMAPVVLGAAAYRLPDLAFGQELGAVDWLLFGAGVLSATVSGYVVARALPDLVARFGVASFCLYRVLLGGLVLTRLAFA